MVSGDRVKAAASLFLGLLAILFLSSASSAEEERVKEPEYAPHTVEVYGEYIPPSGAKAMGGNVSVVDAGSEYTYEIEAFGKLPVEFSIEEEYIGIKNTTEVKLPSNLTTSTIGIETTIPFFGVEHTYLRLGIRPSFYGEDWSYDGAAFRIPSRIYLAYLPDKQWTFVLGVAVYPRFREQVLPIIGFIYKPNDKLTLRLIPDRPEVSYALSEKLILFAEGGSSYGEFAVDKEAHKNTVLEYYQTYLGTGARYKINKFIEASLSCGGVFGHRFQYRDSLGKVNLDDGMYSQLKIEMKI